MMDCGLSTKERRKHMRYKVKDGAYAALSPDSSKMGQIVDISRGGLCFRYIVQMGQEDEGKGTHVFVGDDGIYLEKIPNRVIADTPVDSSDLPGSMTMGAQGMRMVRERRVCFGELNGNQMAQLEYFIINRTIGRA